MRTYVRSGEKSKYNTVTVLKYQDARMKHELVCEVTGLQMPTTSVHLSRLNPPIPPAPPSNCFLRKPVESYRPRRIYDRFAHTTISTSSMYHATLG